MLDYVYRRLWEVLSRQDKSKDFARLSTEDRQAILEILRDTKPSLPAYFRYAPFAFLSPGRTINHNGSHPRRARGIAQGGVPPVPAARLETGQRRQPHDMGGRHGLLLAIRRLPLLHLPAVAGPIPPSPNPQQRQRTGSQIGGTTAAGRLRHHLAERPIPLEQPPPGTLERRHPRNLVRRQRRHEHDDGRPRPLLRNGQNQPPLLQTAANRHGPHRNRHGAGAGRPDVAPHRHDRHPLAGRSQRYAPHSASADPPARHRAGRWGWSS